MSESIQSSRTSISFSRNSSAAVAIQRKLPKSFQFSEHVALHGFYKDTSMEAASRAKTVEVNSQRRKIKSIEKINDDFEKEMTLVKKLHDKVNHMQTKLACAIQREYSCIAIQICYRSHRARIKLKELFIARYVISRWRFYAYYTFRRRSAILISRKIKTYWMQKSFRAFLPFLVALRVIQRKFRSMVAIRKAKNALLIKQVAKRWGSHCVIFGLTRAVRKLKDAIRPAFDFGISKIAKIFLKRFIRRRRLRLLTGPRAKLAYYWLSTIILENDCSNPETSNEPRKNMIYDYIQTKVNQTNSVFENARLRSKRNEQLLRLEPQCTVESPVQSAEKSIQLGKSVIGSTQNLNSFLGVRSKSNLRQSNEKPMRIKKNSASNLHSFFGVSSKSNLREGVSSKSNLRDGVNSKSNLKELKQEKLLSTSDLASVRSRTNLIDGGTKRRKSIDLLKPTSSSRNRDRELLDQIQQVSAPARGHIRDMGKGAPAGDMNQRIDARPAVIRSRLQILTLGHPKTLFDTTRPLTIFDVVLIFCDMLRVAKSNPSLVDGVIPEQLIAPASSPVNTAVNPYLRRPKAGLLDALEVKGAVAASVTEFASNVASIRANPGSKHRLLPALAVSPMTKKSVAKATGRVDDSSGSDDDDTAPTRKNKPKRLLEPVTKATRARAIDEASWSDDDVDVIEEAHALVRPKRRAKCPPVKKPQNIAEDTASDNDTALARTKPKMPKKGKKKNKKKRKAGSEDKSATALKDQSAATFEAGATQDDASDSSGSGTGSADSSDDASDASDGQADSDGESQNGKPQQHSAAAAAAGNDDDDATSKGASGGNKADEGSAGVAESDPPQHQHHNHNHNSGPTENNEKQLKYNDTVVDNDEKRGRDHSDDEHVEEEFGDFKIVIDAVVRDNRTEIIGVDQPGEGATDAAHFLLRSRDRDSSGSLSESYQSGAVEADAEAELRLLSVLVVENSAATRKLIGFLLSSHGHRVYFASDAEELFAMLASAAEQGIGNPFDAILVARYLREGFDGPEVTIFIRTRGYEGLVIGLAGDTGDDDIRHFKAHGADDVLPKPFMMEDLNDIARKFALKGVGTGSKLESRPSSRSVPGSVPGLGPQFVGPPTEAAILGGPEISDLEIQMHGGSTQLPNRSDYLARPYDVGHHQPSHQGDATASAIDLDYHDAQFQGDYFDYHDGSVEFGHGHRTTSRGHGSHGSRSGHSGSVHGHSYGHGHDHGHSSHRRTGSGTGTGAGIGSGSRSASHGSHNHHPHRRAGSASRGHHSGHSGRRTSSSGLAHAAAAGHHMQDLREAAYDQDDADYGYYTNLESLDGDHYRYGAGANPVTTRMVAHQQPHRPHDSSNIFRQEAAAVAAHVAVQGNERAWNRSSADPSKQLHGPTERGIPAVNYYSGAMSLGQPGDHLSHISHSVLGGSHYNPGARLGAGPGTPASPSGVNISLVSSPHFADSFTHHSVGRQIYRGHDGNIRATPAGAAGTAGAGRLLFASVNLREDAGQQHDFAPRFVSNSGSSGSGSSIGYCEGGRSTPVMHGVGVGGGGGMGLVPTRPGNGIFLAPTLVRGPTSPQSFFADPPQLQGLRGPYDAQGLQDSMHRELSSAAGLDAAPPFAHASSGLARDAETPNYRYSTDRGLQYQLDFNHADYLPHNAQNGTPYAPYSPHAPYAPMHPLAGQHPLGPNAAYGHPNPQSGGVFTTQRTPERLFQGGNNSHSSSHIHSHSHSSHSHRPEQGYTQLPAFQAPILDVIGTTFKKQTSVHRQGGQTIRQLPAGRENEGRTTSFFTGYTSDESSWSTSSSSEMNQVGTIQVPILQAAIEPAVSNLLSAIDSKEPTAVPSYSPLSQNQPGTFQVPHLRFAAQSESESLGGKLTPSPPLTPKPSDLVAGVGTAATAYPINRNDSLKARLQAQLEKAETDAVAVAVTSASASTSAMAAGGAQSDGGHASREAKLSKPRGSTAKSTDVLSDHDTDYEDDDFEDEPRERRSGQHQQQKPSAQPVVSTGGCGDGQGLMHADTTRQRIAADADSSFFEPSSRNSDLSGADGGSGIDLLNGTGGQPLGELGGSMGSMGSISPAQRSNAERETTEAEAVSKSAAQCIQSVVIPLPHGDGNDGDSGNYDKDEFEDEAGPELNPRPYTVAYAQPNPKPISEPEPECDIKPEVESKSSCDIEPESQPLAGTHTETQLEDFENSTNHQNEISHTTELLEEAPIHIHMPVYRSETNEISEAPAATSLKGFDWDIEGVHVISDFSFPLPPTADMDAADAAHADNVDATLDANAGSQPGPEYLSGGRADVEDLSNGADRSDRSVHPDELDGTVFIERACEQLRFSDDRGGQDNVMSTVTIDMLTARAHDSIWEQSISCKDASLTRELQEKSSGVIDSGKNREQDGTESHHDLQRCDGITPHGAEIVGADGADGADWDAGVGSGIGVGIGDDVYPAAGGLRSANDDGSGLLQRPQGVLKLSENEDDHRASVCVAQIRVDEDKSDSAGEESGFVRTLGVTAMDSNRVRLESAEEVASDVSDSDSDPDSGGSVGQSHTAAERATAQCAPGGFSAAQCAPGGSSAAQCAPGGSSAAQCAPGGFSESRTGAADGTERTGAVADLVLSDSNSADSVLAPLVCVEYSGFNQLSVGSGSGSGSGLRSGSGSGSRPGSVRTETVSPRSYSGAVNLANLESAERANVSEFSRGYTGGETMEATIDFNPIRKASAGTPVECVDSSMCFVDSLGSTTGAGVGLDRFGGESKEEIPESNGPKQVKAFPSALNLIEYSIDVMSDMSKECEAVVQVSETAVTISAKVSEDDVRAQDGLDLGAMAVQLEAHVTACDDWGARGKEATAGFSKAPVEGCGTDLDSFLLKSGATELSRLQNPTTGLSDCSEEPLRGRKFGSVVQSANIETVTETETAIIANTKTVVMAVALEPMLSLEGVIHADLSPCPLLETNSDATPLTEIAIDVMRSKLGDDVLADDKDSDGEFHSEEVRDGDLTFGDVPNAEVYSDNATDGESANGTVAVGDMQPPFETDKDNRAIECGDKIFAADSPEKSNSGYDDDDFEDNEDDHNDITSTLPEVGPVADPNNSAANTTNSKKDNMTSKTTSSDAITSEVDDDMGGAQHCNAPPHGRSSADRPTVATPSLQLKTETEAMGHHSPLPASHSLQKSQATAQLASQHDTPHCSPHRSPHRSRFARNRKDADALDDHEQWKDLSAISRSEALTAYADADADAGVETSLHRTLLPAAASDGGDEEDYDQYNDDYFEENVDQAEDLTAPFSVPEIPRYHRLPGDLSKSHKRAGEDDTRRDCDRHSGGADVKMREHVVSAKDGPLKGRDGDRRTVASSDNTPTTTRRTAQTAALSDSSSSSSSSGSIQADENADEDLMIVDTDGAEINATCDKAVSVRRLCEVESDMMLLETLGMVDVNTAAATSTAAAITDAGSATATAAPTTRGKSPAPPTHPKDMSEVDSPSRRGRNIVARYN